MLQLGLGFRVKVSELCWSATGSFTLTLKPSPSCNTNRNPYPNYPTKPNAKIWPKP